MMWKFTSSLPNEKTAGTHCTQLLLLIAFADRFCCVLVALKSARALLLLLTQGPVERGERVKDSPQGGWQGCQSVFRQYRRCCRKTP
jgi:hypothetical protein